MSPENYRSEFTKLLDNQTKTPVKGRDCSGSATFYAVKAMNKQMVDNNVPMAKDHFEVCKAQLEKPNPRLCDFLEAENPHVMKSTGSGVAYGAGFLLHQGINFVKGIQSKK